MKTVSRILFDRDNSDDPRYKVGDQIFEHIDLYPFATFNNGNASIYDQVFKSTSGEYIRITTVLEHAVSGGMGSSRGWYVALVIQREDAAALRNGWRVIQTQPNINGMASFFEDIRDLL